MLRGRLGAAALALLAALAGGCQRTPLAPRPVVLIGVDGAEWRVIERLWAEGELPNLKALAERGVRAPLATDYGISPVIWTTIATGRKPAEHGITDFVVPTESGDRPVASTLRRVPALWNMASLAGKRVAVVGWWATWPAEAIRGPMVSDRALLAVEDRISPPEFQAVVDEVSREAARGPRLFRGEDLADRRDELAWRLGARLAAERYELLLVYFRAVDIVSHNRWRFFEPTAFPPLDAAELAAHQGDVPAVYAATDAAIGRILAAAPGANVLVVSDHGFRAAHQEQLQLQFDLDLVLAHLGYLRRVPHGLRWAQTRLYTYDSPLHHTRKKVRFALAGREPRGRVRPAERAGILAALERDLARVRYESGAPALVVREAGKRLQQGGADLVVEVQTAGISQRVLVDGEEVPGVVPYLGRISGTHGKSTQGIFLAAGPDIDPRAEVRGIGIHDLAPTVLYALDLPVGKDFAGRAWRELFRPAVRERRVLRQVASWGVLPAGRERSSPADPAILDELRALGYLN